MSVLSFINKTTCFHFPIADVDIAALLYCSNLQYIGAIKFTIILGARLQYMYCTVVVRSLYVNYQVSLKQGMTTHMQSSEKLMIKRNANRANHGRTCFLLIIEKYVKYTV